MFKKIIVLSVLIASFIPFSPAFAGETMPSASEMQIKDQMRALRECFDKLESSLATKPPAYDDLLKTLDEMTDRAKKIQALKPEGHPGKKFDRLLSDIKGFQKDAKAKSASGVEDSMNRLSENCFRCHLSHEESPAKASGSPAHSL